MAVRVQERGESERRSVMGRIGVATLSYAKAGRLPHGLSSQESFQNLLYGRKANERSNTARAPSGMTWDGINWANVRRHVSRLQTRILKATQGGRHNQAKALQWLLTNSFSGKALALKRVTENYVV